jgi:hypothetical protein
LVCYGILAKPYNFLTAIPTHFATAGQAKRVRLVAPYETRPDEWMNQAWFNLHDKTAAPTRITVRHSNLPNDTTDAAVAVKTYRTVLGDYRTRLEAKSLTPGGQLCPTRHRRPAAAAPRHRRGAPGANRERGRPRPCLSFLASSAPRKSPAADLCRVQWRGSAAESRG